MGDPRKLRKKYEVPQQIWDDARIAEEGGLRLEYGLKNIREIWVAQAELRKIRTQYKLLLGQGEKGNDKKVALLQRVIGIGYCKPSASIDDILSLTTRDIIERRIQTLVYRNGLAKSMKQARQLITHGYISLDGRKVKSPSYVVPVMMQDKLGYYRPINIDTSAPSAKEQKIREVIEAIDEPTSVASAAPSAPAPKTEAPAAETLAHVPKTKAPKQAK